MQIIMSHINTDFDALASMLAAKKLYPDAQVVISDKQNVPVKQYLTIYRDMLDLVQDNLVDWPNITELILVDEASLSRISDHADKLKSENLKITVYDHHPEKETDVKKDSGIIEPVGAAVTLLIEEIRKQNLPINAFEATLFGLGIYTDTGAFTYNNTTTRDFLAASYLLEQGMDLEIINRFSEEMLDPDQQEILNHLFQNLKTYYIDGLHINVSTYASDKFTKGLATLVEKLSEITDADATLIVVKMKNRVYIIGRANSDRVDLLPILTRWEGGGHEQAGSASIKNGNHKEIFKDVEQNLKLMIKPAITARDLMTHPVKTILPETSIEEAGKLMFRYGHSGFPVEKEGRLEGIITRRDLEKANHHGLGHAPVKAYMSTRVHTVNPETTEEEIQQLIIDHNIGRIPVVEKGELVGIVSRTNIIEMMHNKKLKENIKKKHDHTLKDNLNKEMHTQLPRNIYSLLKDISKSATKANVSVYLIGGIVRDIILGQPNDDIDIVVEGDGIAFAKQLHSDYGGKVILHENFKTATWTDENGLEIDITSSRLEFYERPAALPDVETSTLKEDLYRRDFTINAMAIYLNGDKFGQLIDPFNGQLDLKEKKITILHNLSFVEDPTRILRAIRFETRFNFLMDGQTEKLSLQSIERISDLSANRIVGELKKLLSEANPVRSLQRLLELKFFKQFGIKEENEALSCQHAKKLQKLYSTHIENNQPVWFDYFVIPFYEADNLKVSEQFALTKRDINFLAEIRQLKTIQNLDKFQAVGAFHRVLKDYSDAGILFIISGKSFNNEKVIIEYLKRRKEMPTLLTGKDLINQGLKPSNYFTEILSDLDINILNNEINTKEEAFAWLKKKIN